MLSFENSDNSILHCTYICMYISYDIMIGYDYFNYCIYITCIYTDIRLYILCT